MERTPPDDDDDVGLSSRELIAGQPEPSTSLSLRLTSFELEAASNQIVVQANGLPIPQRKARRQTLRNLATRLKQEASTNFGNGTIASGLGFLGGSLVVGVLLVSGPVTIPLIAIGGCGAVTLFGGVGTALVLNRAANNQMHQAGLIENIIAEIDL